jgi:DNA-binding CsgD family transcriptional regulator
MATAEIFCLLQQQSGDGIDSMLQILSFQERRIVALIVDRHTEKEIAVKLQLSEQTVKSYVSKICIKLETRRRTQPVTLKLSTEPSHMAIHKKIPT